MTRYETLLSTLHSLLAINGVIYFQPEELLELGEHHRRGGVRNELPPDHVLPSLAKVALIADTLRAHCGYALTVISAYRTPNYNTAVGGAPNSLHMKGRALDLAPVASGRASDLAKKAWALWTSQGQRWGLGVYPKFVHVDTGPGRTW